MSDEAARSAIAEVKYVVVWHRQPDGGWRWHVDIWNAQP